MHQQTRTQTHIALIEDQQVLSGAIKASLDGIDDLCVIGVAATIGDGLELVARTQPCVLLCDFRLSDGDIADHLPDLLARSPETRPLVFTGWPDEKSFLDAMAAGARGFIDKGAPFEDLLSAIRRVADDEIVVSPKFLPALTRRATDTKRVDALSRRELDVLELLAQGLSTSEIAAQLTIAVNTVRNHVARLLTKLDASSRLEAVNIGVRRGLIRFDPPR